MLFYHTTSAAAAEAILKGGFRNNEIRNSVGDIVPEGVYFSDWPVDIGFGAKGTVTLVMEMPEEKIAEKYDFSRDVDSCREFIIPAEIVNSYGLPRLCSDDEVEQVVDAAEKRILSDFLQQ